MSASEQIFLYPDDRGELADVSLSKPLSAMPFRKILADETNKWKSLGTELNCNRPVQPLTVEEQEELRAMGYLQ
jgi:hypothetical protein